MVKLSDVHSHSKFMYLFNLTHVLYSTLPSTSYFNSIYKGLSGALPSPSPKKKKNHPEKILIFQETRLSELEK